MAQSRIHLYQSPTMLTFCRERSISRESSNRGISALVTRTMARYEAIVREAMPSLTTEEWESVFDALEKTVSAGQVDVVRFAWAEVDAYLRERYSKGSRAAWASALSARIRDLDLLQTIALVDAVERYVYLPEVDTVESALERLRIKPRHQARNGSDED